METIGMGAADDTTTHGANGCSQAARRIAESEDTIRANGKIPAASGRRMVGRSTGSGKELQLCRSMDGELWQERAEGACERRGHQKSQVAISQFHRITERNMQT